MGILDKIIKKDEEKKLAGRKDEDKRIKERKKSGKKSKALPGKPSAKPKKEKNGNVPLHYFDIIEKPHISEKAFIMSEKNKYVFRVSNASNKSEIKKAVESLYNVSVTDVNIIKIPSKPKRYKGVATLRSGYKKAIVSVAKGDAIDTMKES